MFVVLGSFLFFFFKQKTAYEMRISDWSSDVCSSDLFAQRLESVNIKTVEFRQNVGNFSAPTKEFGAAMHSGRISHDGNPVLAWCEIGRASCRERGCQYV